MVTHVGFHGMRTDKIRQKKTIRMAGTVYCYDIVRQSNFCTAQNTANDGDEQGGKHDVWPLKENMQIIQERQQEVVKQHIHAGQRIACRYEKIDNVKQNTEQKAPDDGMDDDKFKAHKRASCDAVVIFRCRHGGYPFNIS